MPLDIVIVATIYDPLKGLAIIFSFICVQESLGGQKFDLHFSDITTIIYITSSKLKALLIHYVVVIFTKKGATLIHFIFDS